MATVAIAGRGAPKEKILKVLGMTLTPITARAIAELCNSSLKTDPMAKYLVVAVKEGYQAEVLTLHEDEALFEFMAYVKKCYGDGPIELHILETSDEMRKEVSAALGELRLH